MAQEGFKRKLTAILSADVVGYSLLMADNEVFTVQTLKAYRQIMSDLIKHHSGRVVDNPGDNLLAEFSSAVDAVECAVEIQKKLKKENERFVEDKKLEFRIGVNIGDVVADDDRIYGNGVNVAARIEGLAEAGGICISRNAYDHVKDKLDVEYDYLGEHEVKNIKEPVRVYKVLLDSVPQKPLVDELLELPDKPSIAVLPFDNMSCDPDQEYFSDGLTDQIINGLSKISNLFVIARNSSFAYKGKSINVQQIGKELGVRYVLEGGVQRAGDRVRITAQLIDSETGYHRWSESYDRDLNDIFILQDEITIKLIWEMGINLTSGEQLRIYENDIKNIRAFDKYTRGAEYYYRFNKQDSIKARHLLEQALELEGTSVLIHVMLGFSYLYDRMYNWSESPAESFKMAEEYAQKALALNDSFDGPHLLLGWIHLFKREYNEAMIRGNQAVALNPNGADALAIFGFILSMSGRPEEAIIHLRKAFRLNPIPLSYYYHLLGTAYAITEQYEKAIEILNKGIKIDTETISPYLLLISSYISLNDLKNAQKAVKKVLEIDPNLSLKNLKRGDLLKDQTMQKRFFQSLRKAGIPE